MVPLDATPDFPPKPADPPADPTHLAYLRPYQRQVIRDVSAFYGRAKSHAIDPAKAVEAFYDEKYEKYGGTRALIVAVTASGKGSVAVSMIVEAIGRGLRVMFVVHRTEILTEIERRLRRLGVERVSLIIGDAPNRYDPSAQVHLVNIASVRHRVLPAIDLLIEDEAHRVLAPTYLWLRENLAPRFICGFTATPQRLDKKPLTLAYDKMFIATQPSHLLEHGWLARARVFSSDPTKRPDVTGVKEKGGDYDTVELSKRVNTKELVGDIVDHWKRKASDLLTVVFAVDIEHSKSIVERFKEAGVNAEHVDGNLTQKQREAVIARMRSGETQVIVNAALWLEGLDVPELKCAVLARPTKSITVYLQAVGRVMRWFEGLQCVILDHASNRERHDLPQIDRDWKPKKKRKRGESTSTPAKRCPAEGCGAEVPLGARVCPECGYEFPPPKAIENVDGELVEVTKETVAKEATELARKKAFERFWLTAYKDGFDRFWVLRRYAERFGEAPPDDWQPPERPVLNHTAAQKRAQFVAWIGVAQRNNLGYGWAVEKFKNRYQEDPSLLDAQPAAPAGPVAEVKKEQPIEPSDRVELEF